MLGIVFAQCWIRSLSPFAYWSKGTFGLRAAEGIVAATAGNLWRDHLILLNSEGLSGCSLCL
jgi:hypothetical protein